MFQRNVLPPSSGSKSKLFANFLLGLKAYVFPPPNGGELLRNYMALHPRSSKAVNE
jgi:hypothetical protein